jgi:hypothetical protein
MTATAQTSVEAGIGVTFVASAMASGSITDASLLRTATMAASVTGAANVTGATLTTVDNVAASVNASATVTNATLNVVQVDPNFANVSLLLHGNGTDGSTTFTDNSPNVLTVTGFGNAQIDTAIKQFGTGSLQFDGNGDYLRVNGGSLFDFGTGSFTMEFFVYLPTGVTQGYIMGTRTGDTNATIRWNIYISTNLIVFNAYNTSNVLIGTVVHQTTLINNVFNHIAVVRNVNEFAIYLNGVKSTTNVTNSTALANSNLTIDIGQATGGFGGSGLPLNGYIDDLRITKGIARYTGATITVPTSQFPDQ